MTFVSQPYNRGQLLYVGTIWEFDNKLHGKLIRYIIWKYDIIYRESEKTTEPEHTA